jgi:hypothetical protein
LAAALLLKVNLDGAIHALQPARKSNSGYGIADSYRGLAYARKRNFGGSRNALEAAVELEPDFPDSTLFSTSGWKKNCSTQTSGATFSATKGGLSMSITRRRFCQFALSTPGIALLLDPPGLQSGQHISSNPPRVNYMLRYFMRSETAQQQTTDLISNCRQNHIHHVILFSNNQWDMGWELPTLDEARTRVEVLRPVFERLRSAGLHVSINMWTTIGHADIGRDERKRFSWQFMVGDDGTESHTAPCPIDPKWKQYVGELYGQFAQLEPEIIYADDDFRYHNHRPVVWGCFCPLHLTEMARRTARDLNREELVSRILTAEPQPTEEREQWLRLCGDSILEATQIISESVKRVSPTTHMGLMCSDPNVHAAEGRRWKDIVAALSVSGNQPVLRPNYASYQDTTYREIPGQLTSMRKLQPLLADKMLLTPELENYPNTRFAKSSRLTRLQIALSLFLASPDITLDIHSFVETRFDYDTAIDQMLRDSFQYFNGVVAWARQCGTERGLQILWDDRPPLHRKVEVARMSVLPAPICWEGAMDLLGFATTFYPDELKLASGSYLEERTANEIGSLLKGKVLMDGDAATLLFERGFAEAIGLRGIAPVAAANYERMVNAQFAGKYVNRDETTAEAFKYRLDPAAQAILVSKMFGPEVTFSVPGMILFQNTYGGRIGIIPQSGSRGDFSMVDFRGWKRQFVLRRMLEWMNQGPLPLFVENAPNVCPLRRDGEDTVVIGIANLSADSLPNVAFWVAPPFQGEPKVEYLTVEGRVSSLDARVTLDGGYVYVQTPFTASPLDLACFRLTKA